VADRLGFTSYTSRQGSSEAERVELHQIVCTVTSEDKVMEAARCIQAILSKLHKKRDYEVTVPLEQLEQREKAQQVFNYVLPIIAGISLLVGGIGILNIMLASITERTREIGIRRALGASRGDIVLQFLVETVVISTIGGMLGVALGLGGAPLLSRRTGWETMLTLWSIARPHDLDAPGIILGLARRAAGRSWTRSRPAARRPRRRGGQLERIEDAAAPRTMTARALRNDRTLRRDAGESG
jgi:putative ABC transport system permease protein